MRSGWWRCARSLADALGDRAERPKRLYDEVGPGYATRLTEDVDLVRRLGRSSTLCCARGGDERERFRRDGYARLRPQPARLNLYTRRVDRDGINRILRLIDRRGAQQISDQDGMSSNR